MQTVINETVAVSSVFLFLSWYIERVSYSWKIRLRVCQILVSQTLSICQEPKPFGAIRTDFALGSPSQH